MSQVRRRSRHVAVLVELTSGDGHPDWRLELPVLVTADDCR